MASNTVKLIDIAVNFTDGMFKGIYHGKQCHSADLPGVLARAWAAGVHRIIVTGGSLKESREALEIAETDGRLFCTVGVHPTRCGEFEESGDPEGHFQALLALAKEGIEKGKVVAVGECGLDYDRLQFCPSDIQKKYFEKQFELAEAVKLPMFLHMRAAGEDFSEMLSQNLYRFPGGVTHSFTGTAEEREKLLSIENMFIGINGCSLKTIENLEIVRGIPAERMMIETDSPYCDIKNTHAGIQFVKSIWPSKKKEKYEPGITVKGRNEPCLVRQVLEVVAGCKGIADIEGLSKTLLISLKSTEERDQEISRIVDLGNAYIQSGRDTLVVTSRQLITGKTPEESLEINYKVSSALVEIVRRIDSRPRYILAKGGITSSDLATKALEARRAKVMGQALAGVPLWQLGPESRHPGVPYIVFPGNVGDNSALAEVVQNWACPSRSSTKELLLNAEKSGYAVGAFNVYNLEGIEAVIAAAEAEESPAILQVHPSALKQGGVPLVACCIAAAERANVPITVHYDHGADKHDLLGALEMGFDSVMVDGSHLPLGENILYTKNISSLAHAKGMLVEAELGRLSGTEDGLTIEEYEARFTDIAQADQFIDETGIDALAVCIGNVHGKYPPSGPNLRLDLLKELRALTLKKGVSLVLHGASGLPHELVKECIDLGVRKFNVNTEVRNSYLQSLKKPEKDLVQVMASAKEAMKAVVAEKMRLFGSAGKA